MKLNKKHHAILKTLVIASKANKELRGMEIAEQTRLPFFFFWTRKMGFPEVYPLLRELEKAGFVTARSDRNLDPITDTYPRYYTIA